MTLLLSRLSPDIRRLLWREYLGEYSISIALLRCTNREVRKELCGYAQMIDPYKLDNCRISTINQVLPDICSNGVDLFHWMGLFLNATKIGVMEDIMTVLRMNEAQWALHNQFNTTYLSHIRLAFQQLSIVLKSETNYSYIAPIRDALRGALHNKFVLAAIATDNMQLISECLVNPYEECIMTFEQWSAACARSSNPCKMVQHILSILERHNVKNLAQLRRIFSIVEAAFSGTYNDQFCWTNIDKFFAFSTASELTLYDNAKKLASKMSSHDDYLWPIFLESNKTTFLLLKKHASASVTDSDIATTCRKNFLMRALANGVEHAAFFLSEYPRLRDYCGTRCYFCSTTDCPLSEVFCRLMELNKMDLERLSFLLEQTTLHPENAQQEYCAMLLSVVVNIKFDEKYACTIFERLQFDSPDDKYKIGKQLALNCVQDIAYEWTCLYFDLTITVDDAKQFMKETTWTLKNLTRLGGRDELPDLLRIRRWQRLGGDLIADLLHHCDTAVIGGLPCEILAQLVDLQESPSLQELKNIVIALILKGQTRVIKRIMGDIVKKYPQIRHCILSDRTIFARLVTISNKTQFIIDQPWRGVSYRRVYNLLAHTILPS